jgi:hypothetical protein
MDSALKEVFEELKELKNDISARNFWPRQTGCLSGRT